METSKGTSAVCIVTDPEDSRPSRAMKCWMSRELACAGVLKPTVGQAARTFT